MAKALVIKNADFETNRVAQVTLTELKPCTGISLDTSTISATSFANQTITATLSPVGCTDTVKWTSSNENVATVSNGTVTIKGLGTATITATCGEYSATCTVTVDNVEITSGFGWGTLYIQGSNDYATAYFPDNYKKIYYAEQIPLDSSKLRMARYGDSVGNFNLTAVPLPYGVGRIRLISNDVSGQYVMPVYDSTQHATNQNSVIKQIAKNAESAPSSGVIDTTIEVASGADSFAISITYKTQYSDSDNVDTVASSSGTKIVLMQAASD